MLLGLAGCGGKGQKNPELVQDPGSFGDADRFLEFFDPQAQLAGGEYEVVASRAAAGSIQGYTLEIDLSSGAFIERNGRWESGETSDTFTFDLAEFGGAIIRLESSADNAITVRHASSGMVVGTADEGGTTVTESLKMLESEVDSSLYAGAYYEAVDPLGERTTLAAWKKASGFADCGKPVIEVKFRDTKDLGYGRHMRACRETPDGGFAFFVDNYQVNPIPEVAYSDLNLDAVLEEDVEWTIGANAIEFTRPQDSDGTVRDDLPYIAKFFTFEPRSVGSDDSRERLRKANLDGRGNKAMPMICVQCHGGRLLPLNPDGTFPRLRTDDNLGISGGVEAKLQALEVDTFEFPESGPFSRKNQEENLRKINETVQSSYSMGDYDGSGEWDSSFVTDLLDGWYGGDVSDPGAEFDQSYVPPGWRPDPSTGSPPVGADDLFTEVISPRCIVCHGKRGSNLQSDINFSTYAKFIGHAEQLEELIFDEALMPAALVEFDAMWEDGESNEEAATIGSFLPDFSHGNNDGTVQQPGDAHADAGPDRTVSSLPVTLSGEDSSFGESFRWELVSSPADGALISNGSSVRATLEGDTGDGDYVVRLTVTDDEGGQDSDTARISVDSGMTINGLAVPAPRDLRFSSAGTVTVRDILQNGAGGRVCTQCHSPAATGTGIVGIPMWWTDGTDQSTTGKAAADLPSLYDRAMTRVNLRDPEASLILRKPSGNHHNAGLITGFDTETGGNAQFAYDLFYTWIIEGAPE